MGLDIGDLEAGECYADGVAVDDMAFEWQCGDPVVWSSVSSTWLDVLGGPRQVGDPRYRDHSSGTPVSVGTAVVVDQVETSVDNDGVPILGSSDSPRHLWLWRPSIGGISPGTTATDEDAVRAVEDLILAWMGDSGPYLTVYSTDAVYEQLGAAGGGYEEFASGTLSGYRFVERPFAAAVEGAFFEVPVELRTSDGPTRTITFVVGRGRPADGGVLRLLVVDVRPGGVHGARPTLDGL